MPDDYAIDAFGVDVLATVHVQSATRVRGALYAARLHADQLRRGCCQRRILRHHLACHRSDAMSDAMNDVTSKELSQQRQSVVFYDDQGCIRFAFAGTSAIGPIRCLPSTD